jgi:hypothetical protein
VGELTFDFDLIIIVTTSIIHLSPSSTSSFRLPLTPIYSAPHTGLLAKLPNLKSNPHRRILPLRLGIRHFRLFTFSVDTCICVWNLDDGPDYEARPKGSPSATFFHLPVSNSTYRRD